jgi:LysR family cys regulon transcriptional activator
MASCEENDASGHRIICPDNVRECLRDQAQDLATFQDAGLNAKFALSAVDADVIKSSVEHGLGVAVLSEAVFDAKRDTNLRAIPVDHLFEASTTQLLVRSDRPLRRHHMDLIKVCVPGLSATDIRRVFLEGII